MTNLWSLLGSAALVAGAVAGGTMGYAEVCKAFGRLLSAAFGAPQ